MKIYIPGKLSEDEALKRTTHLTIAAHEDDIELMSLAVIGECYADKDKFFSGAVVTDGASSPRNGKFAGVTNEEMVVLREEEQKKAAKIGKYSALALLGYSSGDVKTGKRAEVEGDIEKLLTMCSPEKVFTHNPADAHETHVATFCRTVGAIRALPADKRPSELWGCEVWRSLDWLPSEYKSIVDSENGVGISKQILDVFKSQIAGGKDYRLAFVGRQKENATFTESHACDEHKYASLMLDMTSLIKDDGIDVAEYIGEIIEKFKSETKAKIEAFTK
ncbi:MAG: PIG-L family deacetylase [Clostridiales bacterium]|nr:PIG-L family deacetylase [Clostridiales bacterium]